MARIYNIDAAVARLKGGAVYTTIRRTHILDLLHNDLMVRIGDVYRMRRAPLHQGMNAAVRTLQYGNMAWEAECVEAVRRAEHLYIGRVGHVQNPEAASRNGGVDAAVGSIEHVRILKPWADKLCVVYAARPDRVVRIGHVYGVDFTIPEDQQVGESAGLKGRYMQQLTHAGLA